jgi:hypothetical protein
MTFFMLRMAESLADGDCEKPTARYFPFGLGLNKKRLERDSPLVRSLAAQRDSASQHDNIDGCQNRRHFS